MYAPGRLAPGCAVKTSSAAAPGVMLNGALVPAVSAPELAASVFAEPALSMLNGGVVEKVATPATAATVVVPSSVPPPGFVPMASVTFPVKDLSLLPNPSRAVTLTAGMIPAPALAVVG